MGWWQGHFQWFLRKAPIHKLGVINRINENTRMIWPGYLQCEYHICRRCALFADNSQCGKIIFIRLRTRYPIAVISVESEKISISIAKVGFQCEPPTSPSPSASYKWDIRTLFLSHIRCDRPSYSLYSRTGCYRENQDAYLLAVHKSRSRYG